MQDPLSIPTPLVPPTSRRPVEVRPLAPLGWGRFVQAAWVAALWVYALAWVRRLGPERQRDAALVLRARMERMGGIWVKVGQLLAMRNDLLSDPFCEVMSGLQDRASGFPFEVVREIVEDDLDAPLDAVFAEFNEVPMAAGSIGQLHEAWLRHSGTRVAVKVQRPDVAQKFRVDLLVIRALATVAATVGFLPEMSWPDLVWELERTLGEELDYRLEASSIRRMRKNLRRHGVLVPKVFREFSRERVLIMEFVQGVFMSDYIATARSDPERLAQWLRENNIDPARAGERLYMSQMRQLFEDNLFHGDLHPGNILLLRDSRLALIDFGSVGTLERGFLRSYQTFVGAIAREEFRRAAGLYLLLVPRLPPQDLDPVVQGLERSLKAWAVRTQTWGLPYAERSVTSVYAEMGRLLVKYHIPSAWAFLRVNRSQVTVDASLRYLQPHANYQKLGRKYFARAQERRSRRAAEQVLGSVREVADEASTVLSELPELFTHQIEWLRKRARNVEVQASRAAYAVNVLGGALTQSALLAGVGGLFWLRSQHPGRPLVEVLAERLPELPPGAWVVVGLVGLLWLRALVRLRSRIQQNDVPLIEQVRG